MNISDSLVKASLTLFLAAALLEHRQLKRGEIVAEETSTSKKRRAGDKNFRSKSLRNDTIDLDSRQKARQLQSSWKYIAVSNEYLEQCQELAWSKALPRPIPASQAAYVSIPDREPNPTLRGRAQEFDSQLECPKRPKWKYGVSKKELERNEEGNFAKWLDATDNVQSDYLDLDQELISKEDEDDQDQPTQDEPQPLVRSPSIYERNLQVWRQLWRVGEQSNIILVLMDVRCPPVHFPASLRTYLRNLVGLPRVSSRPDTTQGSNGSRKSKGPQSPQKKVVLVLTKSDLVEPEVRDGWVDWCKKWWRYGHDHPPESEVDCDEGTSDPLVVCIESYEREPRESTNLVN